jgi:hypothetical protein
MRRETAPRRSRNSRSGNALVGAAGARLKQSFIAALAADYEQHGAAAIAALRTDKPADYVKLVASLLPKQDAAEGQGGENGSAIAIDVHFVGTAEG